jgi:hypothetical protein
MIFALRVLMRLVSLTVKKKLMMVKNHQNSILIGAYPWRLGGESFPIKKPPIPNIRTEVVTTMYTTMYLGIEFPLPDSQVRI